MRFSQYLLLIGGVSLLTMPAMGDEPAPPKDSSAKAGTASTDAAAGPALVMDRPGEQAETRVQANDGLIYSDFDYLERTEKEFRTKDSRFPEGTAKLGIFIGALNSPWDSGEAAWQKHFAQIDAWRKAKPDSILAPSILGLSLVSYAWVARGTGYADTVTPQGEKLMEDRLAQARKVLQDMYAAHHGKDISPAWYQAMQGVALGQGWTQADYDKLFDEAVAAYPDYENFYFEKAYYILPKWYGAQGTAEKFAEECGRKYGPGLYARIMWSVSPNYDADSFFAETGARWDLMKTGFEELEKQWPSSLWNLNSFCHFAVEARDKATAKRLFARIGSNFYDNVWNSENDFNAAKAWANGP